MKNLLYLVVLKSIHLKDTDQKDLNIFLSHFLSFQNMGKPRDNILFSLTQLAFQSNFSSVREGKKSFKDSLEWNY